MLTSLSVRFDMLEIVSRFRKQMGKKDRPDIISGVHLAKEGRRPGVTITAMTGYESAAMYDSTGSFTTDDDATECTLQIADKFLRESLAVTRKLHKHAFRRYVRLNGGFLTMGWGELDNKPDTIQLEGFDLEAITGNKYPSWRQIYAKFGRLQYEECKAVLCSLSFNARSLAKFAITSEGFQGVRFYQISGSQGDESPILVRHTSIPEFVGVMMPMMPGEQSNTVEIVPSWLFDDGSDKFSEEDVPAPLAV